MVILLFLIGVLSNVVAKNTNGGRMPVFLNVATQHDEAILKMSSIHQKGGEDTHNKLLCDYIQFSGDGNVYSPGDLIMIYFSPVVFLMGIINIMFKSGFKLEKPKALKKVSYVTIIFLMLIAITCCVMATPP